MLLGTLLALTFTATPGDVRFVQDDFGDPPPPPPAVVEGEPDVSAPVPPSSVDDSGKASKPRGAGVDVDGGQGFIEKYFPLALDESLHPTIKDNLWAFWVVQLVPCCLAPQVWLTPLLVGGEAGDNWLMDSLLIYVTHLLPHACLYAAAIPCAFVPIIGAFITSSVFLLNGLACMANAAYLMPVAFANRLNDGFVANKGAGSAWLFEPQDDALAAAGMAY